MSLPELNQKAPAFELKNAAGKFEEISLEKLINENSNLRKSNKIGEKDVIFVCGETRFPFQFTLGSFIKFLSKLLYYTSIYFYLYLNLYILKNKSY